MYQFFVEPCQINEGDRSVIIMGGDVNHIKNVLRMRIGEELAVSNGRDGKAYHCRIAAFEENSVSCELLSVAEESTELPARIYLFQGLPKGDKMELIIQKAVELGVYEIIPVETKRCVVKLDDKKAKSKIARWQGISEAAAKQSKRGIVPQVSEVVSFARSIKRAAQMDLRLIPYELAEGMDKTRELLAQAAPGQDIAIFIGPEGGFEEREIEAALEQDIRPITLGKRILRTETAGLAILSWLVYLLEK